MHQVQVLYLTPTLEVVNKTLGMKGGLDAENSRQSNSHPDVPKPGVPEAEVIMKHKKIVKNN